MEQVKFSHISINCRNPAAVERFYTRHFGFRRARVIPVDDGEIVFLKAGPVYLELFGTKEAAPLPAPARDGHPFAGWRHIAFQVADVDAKLREMGEEARVTLGPLDFGEVIRGWRTAWVADPEGNIVEISQGYADDTLLLAAANGRALREAAAAA